jgi:hypothetical protein
MTLLPFLFGTVFLLPAPGQQNVTIAPNGTTFTTRYLDGTSVILPPRGGAIYDYDEGHGNHVTIPPVGPPTFTFGSPGEDDE